MTTTSSHGSLYFIAGRRPTPCLEGRTLARSIANLSAMNPVPGLPTALGAVGLVLLEATAVAQPASYPAFDEKPRIENIGNRGQLVFGAERITGLAWEHLSEQFTDSNGEALAEYSSDVVDFAAFGGGAQTTALVPRLGLDFFLLDGTSIGIVGMVAHASGRNQFSVGQIEEPVAKPPTRWWVLVQPRMGFAHPFTDTFGLWMRVAVSWSYAWSEQWRVSSSGTTESARASADRFALLLDAMLVVSPMKHFALLFGPFGELGVGGMAKYETPSGTTEWESKLSSLGLASSVVGYFP